MSQCLSSENTKLQVLCDVAVKEIDINAKTNAVQWDSSIQITSILKNVELSEDEIYILWTHKHESTTWKEWIFLLIAIFRNSIGVGQGGLSVDNIYNLTCVFRTDWTKCGPYGGKTIKNTIYSVCSSSTKRNELYVTKHDRRSYYDIAKDFYE